MSYTSDDDDTALAPYPFDEQMTFHKTFSQSIFDKCAWFSDGAADHDILRSKVINAVGRLSALLSGLSEDVVSVGMRVEHVTFRPWLVHVVLVSAEPVAADATQA